MLDSSEDARAKFKKSIEDWAVNELQSKPTNGENINSAKDLILNCYDKSESRLNLAAEGLTSLPSAIGELTNLKVLDLAHNQLTELPGGIGQLTNLERLDVFANQLISLPERIVELTNLEKLNLDGNKLITLPERIVELTNLKELVLDYNKLITLPERIVELTKLERLDVSENQLISLPEGIGQLTNLIWLRAQQNQLISLPERIVELTNLEELILSHNELTELPEGIGELTKLERLDVSQNQLTSLPERIGQLTNLERLDVSKNQLISLPGRIGQLTNLQELDVRENQLISLPEGIVELTNLAWMYAQQNQLTSVTIPEGVDASFDPGVHVIQVDPDLDVIQGSSVNPFLQILTDAGISAEEHQEQQNYFSDSDSNINQAFKRFIAQSASYRESNDLEKKQLAQDLFDIYKNIYQKKDDKEFMDSLNVLCEDSLADCDDRNSLVMIEIDNYAKRKSSTQFEELPPIEKYEYLKSQALFGYFKELGEKRVTKIKEENAEFSEDVEVILNYLRIFNEKFYGELDLTVAKIFKQKYYEEKKYQPTEKEINDFSKIVNDKTALNEIIAGKIAKDFEGNSVYSKIFTKDELADIDKAKADLHEKQGLKLENASEGSSLNMLTQAQEINKEFDVLNQKALTKVILNKLETLQAPSPNVASGGGFPNKRLKTSEGNEQV